LKTIGIYPNIDKDVDYLGTGRVIDTLRGRVGMLMARTLQDALIGALGSDRLAGIRFTDGDTLCREPDAMIVLGGDGTILEAARRCQAGGVPLLGINLGRIGYMAELELDELDELSRLIDGDFKVERRMMLEVQVQRDGVTVYEDIALNDAVVTKSAVARTVHLSVSSDEQQAISLSGDGVIVCTPTGSTAYCMSAGGPLVEPTARCIVVTPICAHDMMSKSLVLSAERTVTVRSARPGRKTAYLSVDGGRAIRLVSSDTVTIRQSAYDTLFLRLRNRSMFEIINAKFRNK